MDGRIKKCTLADFDNQEVAFRRVMLHFISRVRCFRLLLFWLINTYLQVKKLDRQKEKFTK